MHRRLSTQVREVGIPPVRRRKWAGPQPVEFLNAPFAAALRQSDHEYRGVLQEVRCVWLAEARGLDVSPAAHDADFYGTVDRPK
jgi:hypothetical protein